MDVKEFDRQLGAALLIAREHRGFSRQFVQEISRGAVTESMLKSYEKGRRQIAAESLDWLAALYGVAPAALIPEGLDVPPPAGNGSKIARWKPQIDAIVEVDAGSPQRRSVRVIMAELGITDLSEGTVGAYVGMRRRELRDAAREAARHHDPELAGAAR